MINFRFFILCLCLISVCPESTAIALKPATPVEKTISKPQIIYTLPGALDDVAMFNSNSPEVVKEEGILLSTFPPDDKSTPAAHLNFPFEGRFNLFAHHINNTVDSPKPRTLYICALVQNADRKKTQLKILQAHSYLSQPDAPFITIDSLLDNSAGSVFAGPGDRVMTEFLFDNQRSEWPNKIKLHGGETKILFSLPVKVKLPNSRINGRSTLIHLSSDKPVYLATLAMFAPTNNDGQERAPTFDEWHKLLQNGKLAGPRDEAPTIPGATNGVFKYGRVAGVQHGSEWKAVFTDNATKHPKFRIPPSGSIFSFPISTVDHGTFGTLQVQSAPLVVRYPDTAYQSHGNFALEYNLTIPLYNDSQAERSVIIKFQTPIKSDKKTDSLSFFEPLPKNIFFRGTVELSYEDDNKHSQNHYIHLVQKRGQAGEPLLRLRLKSQEERTVELRLFYPPDATPPQVLTIETE